MEGLVAPRRELEAKSESKRKAVLFTEGQVIDSRWKLREQLGQGAFGCIYAVEDIRTRRSDELAIKLESPETTCKRSVLKMEARILRRTQHRHHFVRFESYGVDREVGCAYLVMARMGDSLMKLVRTRKDASFSLPTVLGIGIQAVSSLQTLHETGFIHRDVKPSNIVVGQPSNRARHSSVCHLIDFGLARQFVHKHSMDLLPARDDVKGFRGTPRYASINAHLKVDLARRDDLWSLLYMLVEFTTGRLPWSKLRQQEDIYKCKLEHHLVGKLLPDCPPSFSEWFTHISKLDFESVPDYDYLSQCLRRELERVCGMQEQSIIYDWETGMANHRTDSAIASTSSPQSSGDTCEERSNKASSGQAHASPMPCSGNTASAVVSRAGPSLRQSTSLSAVKSSTTFSFQTLRSPHAHGETVHPERRCIEGRVPVPQPPLQPITAGEKRARDFRRHRLVSAA